MNFSIRKDVESGIINCKINLWFKNKTWHRSQKVTFAEWSTFCVCLLCHAYTELYRCIPWIHISEQKFLISSYKLFFENALSCFLFPRSVLLRKQLFKSVFFSEVTNWLVECVNHNQFQANFKINVHIYHAWLKFRLILNLWLISNRKSKLWVLNI